ncbi:putative MEMBRANE PROTEIN [Labilithrix luteola]|uniref:Putative MEMBRANE PROTEIN n=1 Tax=Labilithrix luteola TaxID=1391654 RepID=A0A0K1Q249_9BACT|nr:DUF58 domain-containing protein [Labilithrix luteola]AKU99454.1 putative MEMBRANE PROTEIN [Labilithrix luteola]
MQLHPTRATFQVALAGAALVAVGVAEKVAPAVAFGGAMILAVTLGRALAMSTVTRIRASGFEMVWSTSKRVTKASRDVEIVLEAELRNRGFDDARGVNLRPVASSMLDVTVHPQTLDLPATSKVRFEMRVKPKRVGRWGIHGIALEVRGTPLGGEGLYEVPLMFANPHGVEVMPKPLLVMLQTARGGRARRTAEAGRPTPLAGEGEQLKELRERMPGDAFKHIAWKASARRGQLLVREMERDERDIVWLAIDASVELWAGALGTAPLDLAIDELGGVAARHLAKGDSVGLVVFASRMRTWLAPSNGPAQASRIVAALASAASMVDADRSELDEAELAQRVAEHLRPLDPRALTDVPRGNLEALSMRAESMRARAPFAPRLPQSTSPREQRFRHYLASFGVEVPPRAEGERERAESQLAELLGKMLQDKKTRPSIVHIWAPPPSASSPVPRAVRRLRAAHAEVRWTLPVFDASLERPRHEGSPTVEDVVFDAVRLRVKASQHRAETIMRGLGVRTRARAIQKPLPHAPTDEPNEDLELTERITERQHSE